MNSWEKVFFDNISVYLLIINNSLSIKFKATPLKKYVKLLGGYAFKSSEYQDKGIPIIRISDFQNEKIVLEKAVYYNESEEFEKYELKAGDIIIALTGGTIGKLAIVQSELGKLYLNQRVAKFQILDTNKIANEYVYWIARGVQDNVKKLAWGGAQPNVSSKQIEEMNFPIPDIETQFKIIEFINDLKKNSLNKKVYFSQTVEENILKLQQVTLKSFHLYSEQEKQEKYITQLKQAILQEAISGKLTAEWRKQNPMQKGDPDTDAVALLAKIKSEKQQLINDGKLKKEKKQDSILESSIVIPNTWETPLLGDITKQITDGTHQTPYYVSNGKIFLSAQNIKPFKFMPENHRYITEEAFSEYRKNRTPEKDDLLIARVGAGIGETAVIDQEIEFAFYVSLALVKIFTELTNADYLAIVCNSRYGVQYAKGNVSSNGVSAGNYNLGRIRSFKIPLPPLAEQKAIVEKVDYLMKQIEELEAQIKHRKQLAEELMQTVLREAFV